MPSDRSARGRRNAEDLPKRRDAELEQEQEQEQEAQVETEQEQQRDALQDQIGNSGVAAMLGLPSIKPGQAGLANEPYKNRDEGLDLQYGGDDVPADGPLTIEDLVRSWNPTTRRGQDPTEPPDPGDPTELPPEDPELKAAILADRTPGSLATTLDPDVLLQPSADAVLEDLVAVVSAAGRTASGSAVHRAWALLLTPPAPILADPEGRMLYTRARAAALVNLLVVDSGVVDGTDGARRAPVLYALLELAARARAIDAAAKAAKKGEAKLPAAADVVRALTAGLRAGSVSPRPLSEGAAAHFGAIVTDLLALPSAQTLVPSMVEPAAEAVEDDPLGVDEVLASSTGGRPDPLTGLYDLGLQAAEKLAGACARFRVHAAGVMAATAAVCEPWSAGAPVAQLLAVAADLDRDVLQVLQLLVEIGRAAQRRTVPPAGIRNGLRRAARSLDQVVASLAPRLSPLLGGVLPVGPDLPLPTPAPPPGDPLVEAVADRRPDGALQWLASLPPSVERDVAHAFVRAAFGGRRGLGAELVALADRAAAEGRPALAAAVSVAAAAAALHDGDDAAALALSEGLLEVARERRNAVLQAVAALTAIEVHRRAGRDAEAQALRASVARACHRSGGGAGLTLLLRWTPPEDP